ncbi:MAG: hypothetical protein CMH41_05550, partial [Micrococcales bacterium]|nr:hypothetical protein [Micrococcales bacterium]
MDPGPTGAMHGDKRNDIAATDSLGGADQAAASAGAAHAASAPTGGAGGTNPEQPVTNDALSRELAARASWSAQRAQDLSQTGHHDGPEPGDQPELMLAEGQPLGARDNSRASMAPRDIVARAARSRRESQSPTGILAGGEAAGTTGPRARSSATSPRPDAHHARLRRDVRTQRRVAIQRLLDPGRAKAGRPEGIDRHTASEMRDVYPGRGEGSGNPPHTLSPAPSFAADRDFAFTPSDTGTDMRPLIGPNPDQVPDMANMLEHTFDDVSNITKALYGKVLTAPEGSAGAARRDELHGRLRDLESSLAAVRRDAAGLLSGSADQISAGLAGVSLGETATGRGHDIVSRHSPAPHAAAAGATAAAAPPSA